jgi:hypothetical protein
MRRLRALVLSVLVAGCGAVSAVAGAGPAQAAPVICEKFGSTTIQSGRFYVQNNVWGADTPQCIDVNQNGGFTVTSAGHNKATNGSPAAYPSIFAGCHYTLCTTGSQLPMQVSDSRFPSVQTSVSMTQTATNTYNASYDIWFDPTPRTDGQNTGAEIMIWLHRQGGVQPVGSRVGSATIAGGTWDVWFGNIGWNVVSYVRTAQTTSLSFAVNAFYSDAVSRGHAQNSWYLTSVQAGFEPWVGGTGLADNSFTDSVGGGGGDTTPPSTPGTPSASNVTATSATLTWAASTDTGGSGLAGYNVHREQGTNDPQLGQSATNSINLTGLTPSTQYQVYVRARDGAGNLSGNSGLVTFTTQAGGGGGGGSCQVTFTGQPWNESPTSGGFTWNFTVRNAGTSTLSAWQLRVTAAANHQFVSGWSATWAQSGQNITGTPQQHNSSLPPGGSTTIGFNGRWSGSYQPPVSITC